MKKMKLSLKQANSLALIVLLLAQCLPSQETKVKHRIMCLGDSITESENRKNSWRYKLVQILYDKGYKGTFDMVGRNSGFRKNPDTTWDSEHCGYYSAKADQLLNGGLPRGRGSHGSIKDWAPKYKPNIALIHLGTNDSRGGQTPESTLQDIADIIGHLRAAVPEVKVVVAQIIPIGVAKAEEIAQDLNSKMPAWADTITRQQSPVEIVDMHSDMEMGKDQGTYHPIGPGSQKMAEKWFAAIEKWLKDPVAVKQVPEYSVKHEVLFKYENLSSMNGDNNTIFRLDGKRVNPKSWSHAPLLLLEFRDNRQVY